MTETPSAAVQVEDLVKRYPKRPVNAVDGVSFQVAPGEVFGLLGPNGAGKTTTIGVLTTRVRLTSGRAVVGGIDVAADPTGARRKLAVVPQRVNVDRSLTTKQNLTFHASYFGVPPAERERRAEQLLDELGLLDRADDKLDIFSGGQAQRVMIARALMHNPEVLFLDEPTTGLDPQARLFVWDRIRALRAQGITIILTTQNIDEAEELADRVGIMDHGKLLALDTPRKLIDGLPGGKTLDVGVSGAADVELLLKAVREQDGVEDVEHVSDTPAGDGPLRLRVAVAGDPAALIAPLSAVLERSGAQLTDVRIGQPSLEDVFIRMTGRGLR